MPHAFTEDQRSGLEASPVFGAVLRLKGGVSPAQAEDEIAALSTSLPRGPVWGSSWRPTLIPLEQQEVGNARAWMVLLLGAAGFVLLVACANVAHLTLARLAGRRRELAIRAALIVLAGVAAGAGAAWALGEAVQAYLFEVQARNGGVLAFVGLLMVIVAVMACWPPALRASRADPIATLKAE